MAYNLTSGDKDAAGISRSVSITPPSHYIVNIQSLSLLAKNGINILTSRDFKAGGYNWKLIIHLNGNKEKNVHDHVSIYVKMVINEDTFKRKRRSEVHAICRFFLFDQNNDDYLVFQDTLRCFHQPIHEWGIDRLISLKVFKNALNGYLVNDKCTFGAEVYVCKNQVAGKVDCLSITKNPISYTHTWNIPNFILDLDREESTIFTAGEQKWKIELYRKGLGSGAGTHISLYLCLADIINDTQVYAEFTLRIVDQDSNANSYAITSANQWFGASSSSLGWPQFISISDMNSPNKGYIKNNTCIVVAEVTVHRVIKAL